MPWAAFDDHFHDSEQALRAGPEACGLHLLATTWCCAHLTDGHIPGIVAEPFIDRCANGKGLVARLIEAGLWEETKDGYRLPLFLEDNRSAEEVASDKAERKRKAQAAAARRWKDKPKP